MRGKPLGQFSGPDLGRLRFRLGFDVSSRLGLVGNVETPGARGKRPCICTALQAEACTTRSYNIEFFLETAHWRRARPLVECRTAQSDAAQSGSVIRSNRDARTDRG